jgi:hypothetical protein
MEKIMLLEDVNLSEIQFTKDGKNIHFDFIDMYEGKPIASLICEDVLHLIYSNCFDDNDYGFACYVGEVTVQTFTLDKDIVQELHTMEYQFYDIGGNILVRHNKLHIVEIEGGEVSIKVSCKKMPDLHKFK